jgi:hypothetical protein
VHRISEMPEILRYAHGPVELDPVVLRMDSDDGLVERIYKQLSEIAAH